MVQHKDCLTPQNNNRSPARYPRQSR